MGEVAPRAHGAVQLGGFLLIALWSLLLPGGLPRGETVAAFRLFRCITFAEFKVQVLQSAECSVGLVMWQFSGAAAAASRRTRAMAHSWWHCVGASGSREQTAWGWGQPLQRQGFCNLLQALFKLGKKVKYHLRTHE